MNHYDNITNNTPEYEGLLAGLHAAVGMDISKIIVRGDSQLVIKQVNKKHASPRYMEEVWKLQRRFRIFKAEYIPRKENTATYELSQLASR